MKLQKTKIIAIFIIGLISLISCETHYPEIAKIEISLDSMKAEWVMLDIKELNSFCNDDYFSERKHAGKYYFTVKSLKEYILDENLNVLSERDLE